MDLAPRFIKQRYMEFIAKRLSIEQYQFLTAFHLKMIALSTMLIDHFARVLYPDLYAFKIVGRVAFILFSFLLVQGFIHTRNVKKYMTRLFLFALVSEVPFDMAFNRSFFSLNSQNVLFTLFAGLLALILARSQIHIVLKIFAVLFIAFLATYFRFDYMYLGVLQVVFFYIFRQHRIGQYLSVGILNIVAWGKISSQAAAILGFVPVLMYNGKEGKKTGLWFYWFYPVHLLLYALIRRYCL